MELDSNNVGLPVRTEHRSSTTGVIYINTERERERRTSLSLQLFPFDPCSLIQMDSEKCSCAEVTHFKRCFSSRRRFPLHLTVLGPEQVSSFSFFLGGKLIIAEMFKRSFSGDYTKFISTGWLIKYNPILLYCLRSVMLWNRGIRSWYRQMYE